jgi:cytochrome c peroxidase
MKISTKIILGAAILALAFILTYRAINQEPSESLSKQKQVTAIMENSGCILCHNSQPKMPFYANWPLMGGKIKRDMKTAINTIELKSLYDSIASGGAIDTSKLSKILTVMEEGTMPPLSFTIFRLGSAVKSREAEIVREWATDNKHLVKVEEE